jgi:hypothetical protein
MPWRRRRRRCQIGRNGPQNTQQLARTQRFAGKIDRATGSTGDATGGRLAATHENGPKASGNKPLRAKRRRRSSGMSHSAALMLSHCNP